MIELSKGGTGLVEWQPIETAPMGCRLLVSCAGGAHEWVDILTKSEYDLEWYDDEDVSIKSREVGTVAKGWMPLPKPMA